MINSFMTDQKIRSFIKEKCTIKIALKNVESRKYNDLVQKLQMQLYNIFVINEAFTTAEIQDISNVIKPKQGLYNSVCTIISLFAGAEKHLPTDFLFQRSQDWVAIQSFFCQHFEIFQILINDIQTQVQKNAVKVNNLGTASKYSSKLGIKHVTDYYVDQAAIKNNSLEQRLADIAFYMIDFCTHYVELEKLNIKLDKQPAQLQIKSITNDFNNQSPIQVRKEEIGMSPTDEQDIKNSLLKNLQTQQTEHHNQGTARFQQKEHVIEEQQQNIQPISEPKVQQNIGNQQYSQLSPDPVPQQLQQFQTPQNKVMFSDQLETHFMSEQKPQEYNKVSSFLNEEEVVTQIQKEKIHQQKKDKIQEQTPKVQQKARYDSQTLASTVKKQVVEKKQVPKEKKNKSGIQIKQESLQNKKDKQEQEKEDEHQKNKREYEERLNMIFKRLSVAQEEIQQVQGSGEQQEETEEQEQNKQELVEEEEDQEQEQEEVQIVKPQKKNFIQQNKQKLLQSKKRGMSPEELQERRKKEESKIQEEEERRKQEEIKKQQERKEKREQQKKKKENEKIPQPKTPPKVEVVPRKSVQFGLRHNKDEYLNRRKSQMNPEFLAHFGKPEEIEQPQQEQPKPQLRSVDMDPTVPGGYQQKLAQKHQTSQITPPTQQSPRRMSKIDELKHLLSKGSEEEDNQFQQKNMRRASRRDDLLQFMNKQQEEEKKLNEEIQNKLKQAEIEQLILKEKHNKITPKEKEILLKFREKEEKEQQRIQELKRIAREEEERKRREEELQRLEEERKLLEAKKKSTKKGTKKASKNPTEHSKKGSSPQQMDSPRSISSADKNKKQNDPLNPGSTLLKIHKVDEQIQEQSFEQLESHRKSVQAQDYQSINDSPKSQGESLSRYRPPMMEVMEEQNKSQEDDQKLKLIDLEELETKIRKEIQQAEKQIKILDIENRRLKWQEEKAIKKLMKKKKNEKLVKEIESEREEVINIKLYEILQIKKSKVFRQKVSQTIKELELQNNVFKLELLSPRPEHNNAKWEYLHNKRTEDEYHYDKLQRIKCLQTQLNKKLKERDLLETDMLEVEAKLYEDPELSVDSLSSFVLEKEK